MPRKEKPENEEDEEKKKEAIAKKREEYAQLLLKPYRLPPDYASTMGFDPADFFVLCRASDNSALVIRRKDRIHMAVFGEPGMGKSTFLLSQIIQHIRNDEGFCVLDPHGDLVKKVLSVIPKEKWDRVVYIDPTTAEEYRRVVKIALLECPEQSKRGLVAMGFVDSLKKMYEDFWGPRLERILINAVYAVMEQPEMRLSDLYDIIIDPLKRERLLANVRDEMVMSYWTNEFPLLKDDAPTAVTNKICRLIQEKIVAPMFDCSRSSVDFAEAMNEGKFVIINLSEGRLTSDVANFLGALILNKIYQEGMAREDIPEAERKPFFVYVDEAHRFVTTSIRDILQALRKYKVYMTLAAQYLGQFDKQGGRDKTLTESIPQLCDALVVFTVGAETAAALEPYFKPVVRYVTRDTLTTLRRYQLVFSIKRGHERYINSGTCVDVSACRYADPRDVIRHSLALYGQEVDAASQNINFEPTPVPNMEPISFLILSNLFYKRECKPTPLSLIEGEMRKYGFTESETNAAIRSLLYEKLLDVQTSTPENGKGKVTRYYSMTEQAKARFKDVPQGQRGGGPEHTAILGKYVSDQRQNGFFCIVDRGTDPTRELPDVIVFPPQYTPSGKIHPRVWDYTKKFAVEIETDPYHHRERVVHNWEKCYKYGLPVNFITTSFKNKEMIIGILSGKATPVQNLLKDYAPGNIQVDRVTASGEFIRSYEEDAIEGNGPPNAVPGAGGGGAGVAGGAGSGAGTAPTLTATTAATARTRTEVEELIGQLKDMKPVERFDFLVGKGWKPFVHVTHSNMKEIHAQKEGCAVPLYIGRYEELKEKYEQLKRGQIEPGTITAPSQTQTQTSTSASTTTPVPTSTPVSVSATATTPAAATTTANSCPSPGSSSAKPETEKATAPSASVLAPSSAETTGEQGAREETGTTGEAEAEEGEGEEGGEETAATEEGAAAAEEAREEEERKKEGGREGAGTEKEDLVLEILKELNTLSKTLKTFKDELATVKRDLEALKSGQAAGRIQTRVGAEALVQGAQSTSTEKPAAAEEGTETSPLGEGKNEGGMEQERERDKEGKSEGEEAGKGTEKGEGEGGGGEDYKDEEVACVEETIKRIMLDLRKSGVKEIGAKELYEKVKGALQETLGENAQITPTELGLICKKLGIERKHTKCGNKYCWDGNAAGI